LFSCVDTLFKNPSSFFLPRTRCPRSWTARFFPLFPAISSTPPFLSSCETCPSLWSRVPRPRRKKPNFVKAVLARRSTLLSCLFYLIFHGRLDFFESDSRKRNGFHSPLWILELFFHSILPPPHPPPQRPWPLCNAKTPGFFICVGVARNLPPVFSFLYAAQSSSGQIFLPQPRPLFHGMGLSPLSDVILFSILYRQLTVSTLQGVTTIRGERFFSSPFSLLFGPPPPRSTCAPSSI